MKLFKSNRLLKASLLVSAFLTASRIMDAQNTLIDGNDGVLPTPPGLFVTPTYLLTSDPTWIIGGFLLQSLFAGAMYSQMPSYLTERFPTEVRATASGFWESTLEPIRRE